ncbi:hypothetical protein Bbelb_422660 [Branchiostoma belcheri]|nr:hypothetical protein Bbelb_422660 [Branchiostoma belcheri]
MGETMPDRLLGDHSPVQLHYSRENHEACRQLFIEVVREKSGTSRRLGGLNVPVTFGHVTCAGSSVPSVNILAVHLCTDCGSPQFSLHLATGDWTVQRCGRRKAGLVNNLGVDRLTPSNREGSRQQAEHLILFNCQKRSLFNR